MLPEAKRESAFGEEAGILVENVLMGWKFWRV